MIAIKELQDRIDNKESPYRITVNEAMTRNITASAAAACKARIVALKVKKEGS